MGMPADPLGFPGEFERAVDVLGNKVRVAVLLRLRKRGPSTPVRLAEQLGVSRISVRKHLLALEELGIVDVDVPRSETDVRKRYFSINDAALAAVLDTVQTLAADSGDREP